MFIGFVPQIRFQVRFRETPEAPAPPAEPPVAARAFGPLGCKLPEGPRIFFSPKPTRQRALSRLMRRLDTIQTVAKNSAACSVETSLEVIPASFVVGPPAKVPTPPRTAAAMLILKTQDIAFDCRFIFVCAGCFRWVNSAGSLYPDHAASARALLQIGFDASQISFI
ncbi:MULTISPECIES: hypothetical protein [unclassified Mesorhizobium]|uniref:hypothetical protein n=1 Tax=unclassified Mesorhizobium TaxID=325217 RepID=UPI0013DEED11|nr:MULTISPECIES: hypothetical protein [unclassified Mesorhizobium]